MSNLGDHPSAPDPEIGHAVSTEGRLGLVLRAFANAPLDADTPQLLISQAVAATGSNDTNGGVVCGERGDRLVVLAARATRQLSGWRAVRSCWGTGQAVATRVLTAIADLERDALSRLAATQIAGGRHYRSSTLAADPARRGWVEPDIAPFPWSAQDGKAD